MKRTTRGKRWKRISLILLAVMVGFIGSGFLYEAIASHTAVKNYPPPGKMVDAGGYSLHMVKKGSGAPAIIFEAGSGETSLSWRDVPDQLAPYATVVTYDRAGYAWSEEADSDRTGANIVEELHTALKAEGIEGPYIMVGHSLGGMYARLFTETYRDEMAGLVLVDARPENDERDTKETLEAENFAGNPSSWEIKLFKRSGLLRLFQNVLLEGMVAKEDRGHFINVISKPAYFDAKDNEGRLSSLTEDAIRGQNLGTLPVRIIARGIAPDYASVGISEEGGRKIEEIWRAGQEAMLEISADSRLTIAEKSGHMVMKDQPELVVEAIQELLGIR
ncbi:alpha/beta hydrolase [Paenibacillus oryzae]|uniref:Alpha/beta hydrolase n=2 Tax=Paenibacillus oryzae TaxID=1844972 RepID=A0A1A5YCX4_9BACL|nr:alpha/beta hydrolase [Paenibacillus oryzae]OBR63448.1 alpha/beta hydrolase [Paenibacillus oryzae]